MSRDTCERCPATSHMVSEGGLELLTSAKYLDTYGCPDLRLRVPSRMRTAPNLHPATPECAAGSITRVSRAGSGPEGDFVGDHLVSGRQQLASGPCDHDKHPSTRCCCRRPGKRPISRDGRVPTGRQSRRCERQ